MGDFFVYILKSGACLIAFYLFFRLLLNKDTFHRFNRIAVLCILVLSLIVPFGNIYVNAPNRAGGAVLELHQLFVEPNSMEVISPPDMGFTWMHALLLVYLAGIIFFIFRNVYFLVRIRCLIQQSRIEKLNNGVKLVIHNKGVSPFSWMNYIVISEDDLKENGKEITTHEMAHVRKLHSIDILLADICIVFQWFNPSAWLIKQELQNIHEYEADEYVLKEGIDAKHYQLLLIKKAVGKRLYSMANSFNHSKLKKRITMMSKQKSSPWARLKYLYVLPVAVLAITAFARPEVSNKLDKISEVKVSDFGEMVAKVNDVVNNDALLNDTIEEFVMTNIPIEEDQKIDSSKKSSLRENDDEEFVMTNIPIEKNEKGAVVKRVSGIVKDSSGNPVFGAAIAIVGKRIGTMTDKDGKFSLEVSEGTRLSISMMDMKSATVKVDKSNYLTVTLTPKNSGKKVIVSSGSSVENGVLNMKDAAVLGESNSPLIFIDGEKSNPDKLKKIEVGDIMDVKVLRKEEATKQYGDEGKNGIIFITTKSK